jgi:hypothetical protein
MTRSPQLILAAVAYGLLAAGAGLLLAPPSTPVAVVPAIDPACVAAVRATRAALIEELANGQAAIDGIVDADGLRGLLSARDAARSVLDQLAPDAPERADAEARLIAASAAVADAIGGIEARADALGASSAAAIAAATAADTCLGDEPSPSPTVEPAATPSVAPSADPSATPSVDPSATPSVDPSATPSVDPSVAPSVDPNASPSVSPLPSPTPAP